ncbi:MAG: outer rane efflux protein [Bacteroidetes bacterium]|nr:outer rane efflux protein [Bacteroidota bacterium]
MKRLSFYIFSLSMAFPVVLQAQSGNPVAGSDSLGLETVINKVIETYPSVKKAELDIETANAKIGLAKSAYYPNIDLSSNYSHVGPTSKFTLPGLGSFQMYPADNYSATVSVNQQIYDFGKTDKSVTLETQSKVLSQMSVEQLKQRLSQTLVGNYYSIVFLQEAIRIKDEELKTLNEHLRFVEKKAASGSATQYEILTTKVRISNIENQKTDLLTTLQVQQSQLNSFLGRSQQSALTLKENIHAPEIVEEVGVLSNKALDQRDELKIARQKSLMTNTRLKMVNVQNNPALNLFATGGYKNGYIPELGDLKANYTVGVSFKVPLFDANRSKYNRQQVQTDLKAVDQDTELMRRNIVNEVVDCRANVDASLKKIAQSELQLQQAQQAYQLAETSFKSGTITNLDLLDSSTSLAESHLAVMKARVDYTVSLLKLKIALGERIY